MSLICLSIDHCGKPNNISDRGAVGHEELCEVDYSGRYAWICERYLRKAGLDTVVISSGSYESRWNFADGLGATAYIALHMNAGAGDRGEIFFDYRTSPGNGVALAAAIRDSLDDRVPWFVETKPASQTARAYRCIEGLRTTGIVYEPAFLDGPRGPLLDYCKAMGRGLADGIITWTWSKR